MISIYQYQLPFLAPLKTGVGEFSSREGVLIRYQNGDQEVISEASPLPGFSIETVDSVKAHLFNIRSDLDSFFKTPFSLNDLQQFISGPPSIQFAISDLSRKILQTRGMQPVNHPIYQSGSNFVLVNDIVGHHDPETTKRLIHSALASGFKTIKIKVPSPHPLLANVLREVYAQREDVLFRLDANQSWNVDRLRNFNKYYKDLPIEYIEEPYALHNDDEIEMVSSISDYPIALDESITDLNHLAKLLKLYPDLFLIIKPMLLGNIFKLSETLSKYRSSYSRVVITSSLESAVGLDTISTLAASLGDNSRAHGLNTGKLFRNNLIIDDGMKNGVLNLPIHSYSTISLDQIDQSLLTLL